MPKTLHAVISDPSRGQIDKSIGVVTIGEASEPEPPQPVDNSEFYETWHCCWVSKWLDSSTTTVDRVPMNFQRGYEYKIAAIHQRDGDELEWHHFFFPEKTSEFSQVKQARGGVDGDIHVSISGGFVETNDSSLNLVKILCRPIRVIQSEAERKYPTDWLERVITAGREAAFAWKQDKEYIGYMYPASGDDTDCHFCWSFLTPKGMTKPNKVDEIAACSSKRNTRWVEVTASNYNSDPVSNGRLRTHHSGERLHKYVYERPVAISTGVISTDDYNTYKRVYWNTYDDATEVNLSVPNGNELWVMANDTDGTNELCSGNMIRDTDLEKAVRYDPKDGYSMITGPDSWQNYIPSRGKIYKHEGRIRALMVRKVRFASTACPINAAMPNLTIPSEYND